MLVHRRVNSIAYSMIFQGIQVAQVRALGRPMSSATAGGRTSRQGSPDGSGIFFAKAARCRKMPQESRDKWWKTIGRSKRIFFWDLGWCLPYFGWLWRFFWKIQNHGDIHRGLEVAGAILRADLGDLYWDGPFELRWGVAQHRCGKPMENLWKIGKPIADLWKTYG